MFSKSKETVSNVKSGSTTLISAETAITGDINFSGTVHIEGRVKGNISAEHGILTIAHSAAIEGDIRAQRVVIDGHVRGNVFAEEHLELASRAVITGNVFYSVIEMTKGSQVNGSLEYHPNGGFAGPQLLENTQSSEHEMDIVLEADN
ncbi:bactofilin family protein [Endozoicomonas ascidiicola]|uniref:bactofilin family protein n=1 Tax=Endozoicomonas ascidiicola TaxID=1698521 RepID=UPI0008323F0D|nr:polymer-forming cytoskeletal protein [Endozoicomonas ascidiicola]